MPNINEIMEDTGRDSNETSLQISSTSPEVPTGRAMHVRKTSSKGSSRTSRTSSSGSSAGRQQPTNRVTSRASTPKGSSYRNRGVPSLPLMDQQSSQNSSVRSASPMPLVSASHRGLGAISPAQQGGVQAGTADVDMDGHNRIEVRNTQQNYYDQRSMQVAVAVGLDPQRVLEHVQSVESQARETRRQAEQVVSHTQSTAQQVVHDVQSQAAQVVHDTQRDAERAVHQAQSRVASVEGQASQLIRDMTNEHHAELARIQDIANHAQMQA